MYKNILGHNLLIKGELLSYHILLEFHELNSERMMVCRYETTLSVNCRALSKAMDYAVELDKSSVLTRANI